MKKLFTAFATILFALGLPSAALANSPIEIEMGAVNLSTAETVLDLGFAGDNLHVDVKSTSTSWADLRGEALFQRLGGNTPLTINFSSMAAGLLTLSDTETGITTAKGTIIIDLTGPVGPVTVTVSIGGGPATVFTSGVDKVDTDIDLE